MKTLKISLILFVHFRKHLTFVLALTKALHNSQATVVAHASERNWFGSSVG
jgi:hypothetical protein